MASRRIIFMGTPEISSIYLQSLIDSDQNIIAVFTQPPRKKGRGMKIQQSPVHKLAEDNSISVFTPTDLNLNISLNKIKELKPDLIVIMGYGLKIPKNILDQIQEIKPHLIVSTHLVAVSYTHLTLPTKRIV